MSDILDLDLNTVDTSFPLIKPGIYELKIHDAEVLENEAKSLALELTTTGPAESDKGEQLEPGQTVFNNVNLNPTGKASLSDKGKRAFLNGVKNFATHPGLNGAGSWTIRKLMTNHKELAGSIVKARIGITPAGPDRRGIFRKARNVVEEYVP